MIVDNVFARSVAGELLVRSLGRTSRLSPKRTTTAPMIDDVRPDPDDFPAGVPAEAGAAAARRGRVKLFAADRSGVTGVPRDRSWWRQATGGAWLRLLAHSALATLGATLTGWLLSHMLPVASLAVIYLVAVLAIAVRQGTAGAIAVSLLSFFAYNYFFTESFFSLKV